MLFLQVKHLVSTELNLFVSWLYRRGHIYSQDGKFDEVLSDKFLHNFSASFFRHST